MRALVFLCGSQSLFIFDVKIRLIYWRDGGVYIFCCKIKCFRLDMEL